MRRRPTAAAPSCSDTRPCEAITPSRTPGVIPLGGGCRKTPTELAGSLVRVGSGNRHPVRRVRVVRPDVAAHAGSRVRFSERAAAFPRRLNAAASAQSDSDEASPFRQEGQRRAPSRWPRVRSWRRLPGAGGTTESGEANFSIALAEHRHERVSPQRVTARATARCGRPRGPRRRCRLYQRGRVEPPVGSAADCRGGQMLVRLIARRQGVLRARVRTTPDCRYRLRGRRFSLPLGRRQVVIRTRFLGSASLTASGTRSIRLRPAFR